MNVGGYVKVGWVIYYILVGSDGTQVCSIVDGIASKPIRSFPWFVRFQLSMNGNFALCALCWFRIIVISPASVWIVNWGWRWMNKRKKIRDIHCMNHNTPAQMGDLWWPLLDRPSGRSQLALEDPGKYTKIPDPNTLKLRNFYPNCFGQFLSEISTTPLPNLNFIQIPEQTFKNRCFLFF